MLEYKEVRLLMAEKIIEECLQEIENPTYKCFDNMAEYYELIVRKLYKKLQLEKRIENYYRHGNKDIA